MLNKIMLITYPDSMGHDLKICIIFWTGILKMQ